MAHGVKMLMIKVCSVTTLVQYDPYHSPAVIYFMVHTIDQLSDIVWSISAI